MGDHEAPQLSLSVSRTEGSHMDTEKTTIEWAYEPIDFFEGPMRFASEEYTVDIQNGIASAILNKAQEPVPTSLLQSITDELHVIFKARKMFAGVSYKLSGYTINYYKADGSKKAHVLIAETAMYVISGMHVDMIITNKDGTIIHDSKSDRILEQKDKIDAIRKASKNAQVVNMALNSYSNAVSDPDNEFVYLYEIVDAVVTHYGGEKEAISRLGISRARWKRLTKIANREPIKQSRHRGKHNVIRPASQEELDVARSIARELVERLSNNLK